MKTADVQDVVNLRSSKISSGVVFAVLASTLFISLALAVHNAYTSGARLTALGFELTSSGLFRPLLVAAASWLALGHLLPTLRPRRAQITVLACLLAYSIQVGGTCSGDVVPTHYTALAIASGQGSSLDGFDELLDNGLPYFVTQTPLGLRSSFPIGPALVAWPVFLPARWVETPRAELTNQLGQLSALLIGLASVWLALQIARRLDPPFSPYLLALIYGLGTSHWSTSSYALWQHGPGELWVLGGLERLLDRDTPVIRRLAAAGCCMSLAAFTRPNLALSALMLFVLSIVLYRRKALIAAASAIVVAGPLAAYHLQTFGSILGSYSQFSHAMSMKPLGEWLEVLFWMAASPSRGMMLYEPVVVFTLVVAVVVFVTGRRSWYLAAGLAGFSGIFFLYGHWSVWWGGHCFGPRYMTDALPWWFLATAAIGRRGPVFRTFAIALAIWGGIVNGIGTTSTSAFWDSRPTVDRYPDRLKSFQDSQLVMGILSNVPGRSISRRAIDAETRADLGKALSLWQMETTRRPWNLFAASRIADLLIRTDQLETAIVHAHEMKQRWPGSLYAHQLDRWLPAIQDQLGNDHWISPVGARASRNESLALHVCDGSLGTHWSTGWSQRETDWLELATDPSTPIRGVTLFHAPDFSEGPFGLSLTGLGPNGDSYDLSYLPRVKMRQKGWVTLRFPPRRLSTLKLQLTRNSDRPWAVSEVRLIAAE